MIDSLILRDCKHICFSAFYVVSSSGQKNGMKFKRKTRRFYQLAQAIPYFCHWSSFMSAFSSFYSSIHRCACKLRHFLYI